MTALDGFKYPLLGARALFVCSAQVQKAPKPVASCAMPAAPNMVVKTETPIVRKAREGVMEFLLVSVREPCGRQSCICKAVPAVCFCTQTHCSNRSLLTTGCVGRSTTRWTALFATREASATCRTRCVVHFALEFSEAQSYIGLVGIARACAC